MPGEEPSASTVISGQKSSKTSKRCRTRITAHSKLSSIGRQSKKSPTFIARTADTSASRGRRSRKMPRRSVLGGGASHEDGRATATASRTLRRTTKVQKSGLLQSKSSSTSNLKTPINQGKLKRTRTLKKTTCEFSPHMATAIRWQRRSSRSQGRRRSQSQNKSLTRRTYHSTDGLQ